MDVIVKLHKTSGKSPIFTEDFPVKDDEYMEETTKDFQCRRWHIVIWNYTEELLETIDYWCKGKDYIIGKEICDETGKKHIHWYFEKKCSVKRSTIENVCKGFEGKYCKALKTKQSNIIYCSKNGLFINKFTSSPIKSPAIDLKQEVLDRRYKNVVWKKWQRDVLDIIESEPDDRTIHWILDRGGNQGKTFLTNYIFYHYDCIVSNENKENITKKVIKWIEKNNKHPKIIIFDIPKNNTNNLNYTAIEKIKDGCIYSDDKKKYLFHHPHVIIFTNNLIITDNFSKDRSNIVNITDPVIKERLKKELEDSFNMKF